jgi:hypothetical protein
MTDPDDLGTERPPGLNCEAAPAAGHAERSLTGASGRVDPLIPCRLVARASANTGTPAEPQLPLTPPKRCQVQMGEVQQ